MNAPSPIQYADIPLHMKAKNFGPVRAFFDSHWATLPNRMFWDYLNYSRALLADERGLKVETCAKVHQLFCEAWARKMVRADGLGVLFFSGYLEAVISVQRWAVETMTEKVFDLIEDARLVVYRAFSLFFPKAQKSGSSLLGDRQFALMIEFLQYDNPSKINDVFAAAQRKGAAQGAVYSAMISFFLGSKDKRKAKNLISKALGKNLLSPDYITSVVIPFVSGSLRRLPGDCFGAQLLMKAHVIADNSSKTFAVIKDLFDRTETKCAKNRLFRRMFAILLECLAALRINDGSADDVIDYALGIFKKYENQLVNHRSLWDVRAHSKLMLLLALFGKGKESIELFNQAVEKGFGDRDFYAHYLGALKRIFKYDAVLAISELEELIPRVEKCMDSGILAGIVSMFAAKGETKKAVIIFSQFKSSATSFEAYLAMFLICLGGTPANLESALHYASEAHDKRMGTPKFYFKVVLELNRHGHAGEAGKWVKNAQDAGQAGHVFMNMARDLKLVD